QSARGWGACDAGVGAEPAAMALAKHRDGGDVALVRLLDGELHRLPVDVEAEPPMAVDNCGGRRFLHDGERGAGHDVARLDAIDLSRYGYDTVIIVAVQSCFNVGACDPLDLLALCASCARVEDLDFLQEVGSNRGHFLALPFVCAVSDRRRGRIAAARPRARPRRPHGRSR